MKQLSILDTLILHLLDQEWVGIVGVVTSILVRRHCISCLSALNNVDLA